MKHIIFFTSVALLCGAAFGQQEQPSGKQAAKAQMKVDAKTGQSGAAVDPMDTNGDGMVSRKEWDAHHGKMWGRMKLKNGMVSVPDMHATVKGGPN